MRPYLLICTHMRPYAAICAHMRPCVPMCAHMHHMRPHAPTTICPHMRPYAPICAPYVAACGCLWLPLAVRGPAALQFCSPAGLQPCSPAALQACSPAAPAPHRPLPIIKRNMGYACVYVYVYAYVYVYVYVYLYVSMYMYPQKVTTAEILPIIKRMFVFIFRLIIGTIWEPLGASGSIWQHMGASWRI